MGRTDSERFWQKVWHDEDTGCWVWLASLSSGYGQFYTGAGDQKKKWKSHRYAYEVMIGPIPEGLDLDHLCRNRACINPYHLDPVPNDVNHLRATSFALQGACQRGHVDNPRNTRTFPSGKKYCRVCALERQRANIERHRRQDDADGTV